MAQSFAEYMAGPPGDRLRAMLDDYGGAGTDHPGGQHAACRAVGQRAYALTRCCGKRIEFGEPLWLCEIGARPEFGPDPDVACCDRPYVVYGIDHAPRT